MDISLGILPVGNTGMLSCDCSVYIYMYMDDIVLLHSWILYIDVNTSFHNIMPSQTMEFVSQEVYTSFDIAKEFKVPILLAQKVLHTRGYMLLQWAKTQIKGYIALYIHYLNLP